MSSGLGFLFLGSIMIATMNLIYRITAGVVSVPVFVMVVSVASFLASLVVYLFATWGVENPEIKSLSGGQIMLLVGFGVVNIVAMILLSRAFEGSLPIGVLSVTLGGMGTIITAVLGFVFLGEGINLWQVVGMGVIFLGIAILTLSKAS